MLHNFILNGSLVSNTQKFSDGGALSSNDKKNISEFIKTIENEVQSKNPIKKPRELFFGDSEVKYKLEWKQDEQDENMYSLRLLRFNDEIKKYVEEDSMRDSMFIIYAKLEDYRDNFYKYAGGGGVGMPFTFTKNDKVFTKGDISVQRVGGSDKWEVAIKGKPMGRVLGAQTSESAIKKAEKDFSNKLANGGGVGEIIDVGNETGWAWSMPFGSTGFKSINDAKEHINNNFNKQEKEGYDFIVIFDEGVNLYYTLIRPKNKKEEKSFYRRVYFDGGGLKQKGKTDKAHDKVYKAKRVGYRYTDKRAKKLGLSSNAKPTQEHIDKYLGNGVYKEDRANRSDKSRMKKLNRGGNAGNKSIMQKIQDEVKKLKVENPNIFKKHTDFVKKAASNLKSKGEL